MKFYLWFSDIPELSTFCIAQRRRIGFTCLGKAVRNRRFWLVLLVPFLLYFVAFGAVLFYMAVHAGNVLFTFASIAGFLISVGVGVVANHYYFRFILPYVRELLPGFCSSCGYNLTNNVSGVCPECGVRSGADL